MNFSRNPEDCADYSRDKITSTLQIDDGDDVVVIKPSNRIDRLGLPQVWKSRYLLKYFVMRAIRGRYRPTSMGYGWIVFRPFLLCLVYVGVFGYLMGVHTKPIPFPLFVFLGISLYLFLSGTMADTASSLTNNAGIISKVYYPRLIVPLTSLLVNILDLLASLVVVVGLMLIYRVMPGQHFIYFPFFLGAFALLSFAIGLVLAAHSIDRKDIMMALPIILRVIVYAMPCVYPVSQIPQKILPFYYLNPMAALLQAIRWSLWDEILPPIWALLFAFACIGICLYYGLVAFNRAERTMVDSL